MSDFDIELVAEPDLDALLPLMRGYCDFYDVAPSDEELLALARALIADPEREGVQFIARDADGTGLGFATIYWTWSTSKAARIGVMNDLFVAPEGRRRGVGEALIHRCIDAVREHGGAEIEWKTAVDNLTAQSVYDRVGGTRAPHWLDYSIALE